jgi:WD40 repeat protein
VQVFDTGSGRLIATLDAVQREAPTLDVVSHFAGDLEFTPDGELLVVAVSNGAVYRYDTETWQQVGERIPPEYGFQGIDFTSDGSTAATLHWENGMELRRGSDLALLRGPVPTINVSGLGGQNPDILAGDRYAVTGGFPGGATLWDLETLTPVGDPFPHVTDYRHPSLAADAKLLATTTGTEAVIWNVDVESWPDIACRAAGRNMTADEWPVFGPQYEGYHATCPQWPALG